MTETCFSTPQPRNILGQQSAKKRRLVGRKRLFAEAVASADAILADSKESTEPLTPKAFSHSIGSRCSVGFAEYDRQSNGDDEKGFEGVVGESTNIHGLSFKRSRTVYEECESSSASRFSTRALKDSSEFRFPAEIPSEGNTSVETCWDTNNEFHESVKLQVYKPFEVSVQLPNGSHKGSGGSASTAAGDNAVQNSASEPVDISILQSPFSETGQAVNWKIVDVTPRRTVFNSAKGYCSAAVGVNSCNLEDEEILRSSNGTRTPNFHDATSVGDDLSFGRMNDLWFPSQNESDIGCVCASPAAIPLSSPDFLSTSKQEVHLRPSKFPGHCAATPLVLRLPPIRAEKASLEGTINQRTRRRSPALLPSFPPSTVSVNRLVSSDPKYPSVKPSTEQHLESIETKESVPSKVKRLGSVSELFAVPSIDWDESVTDSYRNDPAAIRFQDNRDILESSGDVANETRSMTHWYDSHDVPSDTNSCSVSPWKPPVSVVDPPELSRSIRAVPSGTAVSNLPRRVISHLNATAHCWNSTEKEPPVDNPCFNSDLYSGSRVSPSKNATLSTERSNCRRQARSTTDIASPEVFGPQKTAKGGKDFAESGVAARLAVVQSPPESKIRHCTDDGKVPSGEIERSNRISRRHAEPMDTTEMDKLHSDSSCCENFISDVSPSRVRRKELSGNAYIAIASGSGSSVVDQEYENESFRARESSFEDGERTPPQAHNNGFHSSMDRFGGGGRLLLQHSALEGSRRLAQTPPPVARNRSRFGDEEASWRQHHTPGAPVRSAQLSKRRLIQGILQADAAVVAKTINRGEDVNSMLPIMENRDTGTYEYMLPIFAAAIFSSPQVLRCILDFGAPVNSVNKKGQTALHAICSTKLTRRNSSDGGGYISDDVGARAAGCSYCSEAKPATLLVAWRKLCSFFHQFENNRSSHLGLEDETASILCETGNNNNRNIGSDIHYSVGDSREVGTIEPSAGAADNFNESGEKRQQKGCCDELSPSTGAPSGFPNTLDPHARHVGSEEKTTLRRTLVSTYCCSSQAARAAFLLQNAQLLIDHGVDVWRLDEFGNSAFKYAELNQNSELVELLRKLKRPTGLKLFGEKCFEENVSTPQNAALLAFRTSIDDERRLLTQDCVESELQSRVLSPFETEGLLSPLAAKRLQNSFSLQLSPRADSNEETRAASQRCYDKKLYNGCESRRAVSPNGQQPRRRDVRNEVTSQAPASKNIGRTAAGAMGPVSWKSPGSESTEFSSCSSEQRHVMDEASANYVLGRVLLRPGRRCSMSLKDIIDFHAGMLADDMKTPLTGNVQDSGECGRADRCGTGGNLPCGGDDEAISGYKRTSRSSRGNVFTGRPGWPLKHAEPAATAELHSGLSPRSSNYTSVLDKGNDESCTISSRGCTSEAFPGTEATSHRHDFKAGTQRQILARSCCCHHKSGSGSTSRKGSGAGPLIRGAALLLRLRSARVSKVRVAWRRGLSRASTGSLGGSCRGRPCTIQKRVTTGAAAAAMAKREVWIGSK